MLMFDQLIRRWWIVAVRGMVAMIVGGIAFVAPDKVLAALLSFFGIFALADGIFTIGAGLASNWHPLFLEGLVGCSVGLLTLFLPGAVRLWFVPMVAAWAFVTGALELVGAYTLSQSATKQFLRGEWLLAISGACSIAFGAVVTWQSAVSIPWTLGGYALLSGALLVSLALTIRTWPPTG